jgi:hypothetical protein
MTPLFAAVTKDQWPQIRQQVEAFGALQTIAFLRVDAEGRDVYDVRFEHARAEVTIAPLTRDGKTSGALLHVVPEQVATTALTNHRNDTAPSPGTEAFLRGNIESYSKGQPDYSLMDAAMAADARMQWPRMRPAILARGPLKSLTFLRVSPEGYDVYDAVYEHAEMLWTVAPLGPDGKESFSLGVLLH